MTTTQTERWAPTVYTPTPSAFRVKALLYGKAGAGKSTLGATASVVPEMSPVLYLNAESGIMSICEDWEGRIDTSRIDVVDFQGYKQLLQLFDFLAFSEHKYKTIVLDSLTELQTYVVTRMKNHYIQKNEQGFAVNDQDDKKLMLKVYDRSTEQLRELCRKFRDLPMHVIMMAHDDKTEVNGQYQIHPALTPKFRDSVVGYMDLVGYLATREAQKEGEEGSSESEIQRLVSFVPRPTRTAKDRSPGGKLGSVIIDPTFQEIWSRITA